MEDPIQFNGKAELNKLTVKDIFFKYIRFLPLFVLSVALALFGAWLYLRYTVPEYQASGSIILRNDRNQTSSNEKFEQLFVQEGQKNIQAEIEFMRSRPIMERVVKDLGLNYTYYAVGKVKDMDLYKSAPFSVETIALYDSSSAFSLKLNFPNTSSFKVNSEDKLISFGQVFKTGNGEFRLKKELGQISNEYRVEWAPTSAVAGQLSGNLIIAPRSQGTGILNILMESTHPQRAADVINKLMVEYQVATIEEKKQSTQNTLDFIDERLNEVEKEVNEVTNRYLSFRQRHKLIDPEAQGGSYFSRIEEYDNATSEQRAQLDIARLIENYLRDQSNHYNLVPSSLGLDDPTLNTMISAFNVAVMERKMLLDKNVPATNVKVKEAEEQIEKLRLNILESLRNVKSVLGSSLSELQRKNADVLSQITALPLKEQELLDIKREQETKLAVYNILLEKKEQLAITKAGTISNTKVLDPAVGNGTPVSPNKKNVQLIAVFIGLLLPALFVFALEMLNDKVTTRHDIEKITDATILGEVGHSYAADPLVVTSSNRSVVAEQFRIIRSNLQYVLNNIDKPVILVTSSFSGEGKSFVSTNIGAVMALAGKKTVVLEFDIRKPKVLTHLNMGKRPGLTNYLLGKVTAEELPVQVPGQENLFVIACGPIPPNPSEMLLDARIAELFSNLKANYDVIMVDTAPVGMVSDALTLSKFADATLYIVRQGHTYKKQIGLIDELYRQGKLPKISLILNDVKLQAGYGYYGYGRYGYGHGYGSGYFVDEEAPAPSLMNTWLGWIGLNGKHKKKKRKKELV